MKQDFTVKRDALQGEEVVKPPDPQGGTPALSPISTRFSVVATNSDPARSAFPRKRVRSLAQLGNPELTTLCHARLVAQSAALRIQCP